MITGLTKTMKDSVKLKTLIPDYYMYFKNKVPNM